MFWKLIKKESFLESHQIQKVTRNTFLKRSIAIAFYENRNFRQHASFPYYYTIKGIPCEGSSYVIYMNGGYRDYPFIFLLIKRFSLFIFICVQKIVTNICPNQEMVFLRRYIDKTVISKYSGVHHPDDHFVRIPHGAA